MPDAVLALNAGSSSIKFAVFELAAPAARLRGTLEGIGTAPHFSARDTAGTVLAERRWDNADADHATLLGAVLDWIEQHLGDDTLAAVGHRVVHGGAEFTAPVRLDAAVLARLAALTPLAPLHQPYSLAPVRAIMASRPALPQVACFDTAFHHTMPPVATRLPLPFAWAEQGVRRYGFHGLSYEYIARRLRERHPRLAAGRVVVAHLGNGASLCALRDGVSIDTTMGFSALDGLMMGTRCGSIDPGVLLYLLRQQGVTAPDLEQMLYKKSGLLGVSGLSSDMRSLLASDSARAHDAVESFVFRIGRETAALAASLGGLDGFIFTAGIGEHAPEIQDAVCDRLRWLGVARAPRDAAATRLSAPGSAVEVHVIPTDEEAMIARHTLETLNLAA